MNLDLPVVTGVVDLAVLLGRAILLGLSMVLHTWWGVTFLVPVVAGLAAAFGGRLGVDEDAPFDLEHADQI